MPCWPGRCRSLRWRRRVPPVAPVDNDPALRDRPIQGLQILTLRPGADPRRFEGDIYNPQDGNIYSGSVEVLGPDSLRLQGCVLYVLCQQQEWQRVQPPEQAESGS